MELEGSQHDAFSLMVSSLLADGGHFSNCKAAASVMRLKHERLVV
jgi:hypothetical protein